MNPDALYSGHWTLCHFLFIFACVNIIPESVALLLLLQLPPCLHFRALTEAREVSFGVITKAVCVYVVHCANNIPMTGPKYFTPNEVSMHNSAGDLWVSYLGKVYNLTPLAEEHKGDVLLKPIIDCAGKDISHWFNPKTKDICTHIDPVTCCVKYYTPKGRFLHVSPPYPRTDWANDFGTPWWKSSCYEIGLLSAKTRWIRIINMLTSQELNLEVCSEETMNEILQRYLHYNSHAASYTWKHDGTKLDMSKTLSENGIPDEDEELNSVHMDSGLVFPYICLYFNDDLTEK